MNLQQSQILVFSVHAEALAPHHLRELTVGVSCEIYAFLLLPILVHHDEIRVMPLLPPNLEILPLLPALFLFQPASNIMEVVQFSSFARNDLALLRQRQRCT